MLLALLGCRVALAQTVDPALLAQLTFLEPGVTFAQVSERLGAPYYRYDADLVVSYPAFEQHGSLYVTQPSGISKGYQLMLKFSDDWRLERASLISRAFYFTGPIKLE
jgi:hypothetical protein